MPRKETEKDQKVKAILCPCVDEIKMAILPKTIYRFNILPAKITIYSSHN